MSYTPLELSPAPRSHALKFRGDTFTFTLKADPLLKNAKAYLHTNIGYGRFQRAEIVAQVEDQTPNSSQDWHDVPMPMTAEPGVYRVRMILNEVGHFEASCCLITHEGADPIWVEGGQVHINVEPATYCCSNSIYCAFVRQFGPNKYAAFSRTPKTHDYTVNLLETEGYTVIPPSGKFRDLIKELDFIIGKLKCRIIHLLPINPTPTIYARMGRYGSPYASLDFTAVDPSYAEFERDTTPLDQFLELVDAVHFRDAKIFIDLAINHTGWAAKIHETHPEWLVRNPDGSIHSPGAWGVVWGDLTELNHNCLDLWEYLADVFLTWCSRGVDGFRCDAGYMIPFPAWHYIIARVRESYPDTIFFLEGLGGDPMVTLKLLNQGNMNWAYSELFQNYSREAIEGYINYSTRVSEEDGIMVNYAETHDNLRLAATSPTWAKMRTALSALTSAYGSFGFTNGLEWFAKEKVDVHKASALNWGAKENQVDFISRLNTILNKHPAFHPGGNSRFIDGQPRDAIMLYRTDSANRYPILVCININCEQPIILSWKESSLPFRCENFVDLISGQKITPLQISGSTLAHTLQPGEALCLAENDHVLNDGSTFEHPVPSNSNRRILLQSLRAQILDILSWRHQTHTLDHDVDVPALAWGLYRDPAAWLKNLYSDDEMPAIVHWNWPEDAYRQVMIPPHHLLFLTAPAPFSADIVDEEETVHRHRLSVEAADGSHFAVFIPFAVPKEHRKICLRIFTTRNGRSERRDAPCLLLSPNMGKVRNEFPIEILRKGERDTLLTNGKGAMIRPCVEWGELRDRYNTLLAANFNLNYPEDRHIMFRRLRIRVQHHARFEELRLDLTENFKINERGEPLWSFCVPIGKGLHIHLAVTLAAIPGENAVRLSIKRPDDPEEHPEMLSPSDNGPIRILLYPDLEDRNFHNETKAYTGPEREWPHRLIPADDGRSILFAPASDRLLRIAVSRGHFVSAPNWFYNVWQQKEADRGLNPCTDIWNPGYFESPLAIHEEIVLSADIFSSQNALNQSPPVFDLPPNAHYAAFFDEFSEKGYDSVEYMLRIAMADFIVDRDTWKTVIAGYPWFLDWGRDTLICARGLLSAGFIKEVRAIILQFAHFIEKGTMPNIIHGSDVSNRDTSDATLWLFVAVRDYLKLTNDRTLLAEKVRGSLSLSEVLAETAQWHIQGTPNGIVTDPETNLLYSPPHFTWMDTNYPAGTPREGYPIEIQALWFAAQRALADFTGDPEWRVRANQTRESVLSLFILPNGSLSDCLNAAKGTPARVAIKTDHNRCNQLFAITLGLVKDPKIRRAILSETNKLLIPGAIRSLADQPVQVPIPIYNNGISLNDPNRPYWGVYEGDEDTRRKPAYHNGTAWTWPFPSYAEALVLTYKASAIPTAKAILSSMGETISDGCVCHLPEIMDGNYPHKQRGCDAQAWGVTEAFRVWDLLLRKECQ